MDPNGTIWPFCFDGTVDPAGKSHSLAAILFHLRVERQVRLQTQVALFTGMTLSNQRKQKSKIVKNQRPKSVTMKVLVHLPTK